MLEEVVGRGGSTVGATENDDVLAGGRLMDRHFGSVNPSAMVKLKALRVFHGIGISK